MNLRRNPFLILSGVISGMWNSFGFGKKVEALDMAASAAALAAHGPYTSRQDGKRVSIKRVAPGPQQRKQFMMGGERVRSAFLAKSKF